MTRSTARPFASVVVVGAAILAAPMAAATEGAASSPAMAVTSQDAPSAGGAPGANPLWAIALRQLSSTRERPVFSPSRRPPPPPPPVAVAPPPVEKPKEPEKPQLALLGTVVNHDESYGIFMDQTVSRPVRIRLGSSHRGWTLRKITVNAAALEKEGQTEDIAFPKKRGEPEPKKQGIGGFLAAAGSKLRGALEKIEGSSPPAGDQPEPQAGLRPLKNPFAAQQENPAIARAPAQAN